MHNNFHQLFSGICDNIIDTNVVVTSKVLVIQKYIYAIVILLLYKQVPGS